MCPNGDSKVSIRDVTEGHIWPRHKKLLFFGKHWIKYVNDKMMWYLVYEMGNNLEK